MLNIKNLSAGYGDLPVLRNVSLDISSGTMTVLMGPNGAGKSTLLRAIVNLVQKEQGEVIFLGQEISSRPTHELPGLGLIYVPQGRINFGLLTVEENLMLGGYHLPGGMPDPARLTALWQTFPQLAAKRNAYAFTLSGGEQQMLALARALVATPKLLLLDEPSLGLSPKLVQETFARIATIREQFGVSMLIVEHNIASVLQVADRGVILVEGQVIANDTAARLRGSDVLQKVFVGAFD